MNVFMVSKVKGERVLKRRRWIQSVGVLQESGAYSSWGTGCEGRGSLTAEMQTPPPIPIPLSSFARTLCKLAHDSCPRTENSSILNKVHFKIPLWSGKKIFLMRLVMQSHPFDRDMFLN